jgi:hypothetical protein
VVYALEHKLSHSPGILRGFHQLQREYVFRERYVCLDITEVHHAYDSSLITRWVEFMDEVTCDWGGKPFEDLLLGWKYVQTRWPEVSLLGGTPSDPRTQYESDRSIRSV